MLEPGGLAAGDSVELVSRSHPGLTIARANDALYRRSADKGLFEALLACSEMPEGFKRGLRSRLAEIGS